MRCVLRVSRDVGALVWCHLLSRGLYILNNVQDALYCYANPLWKSYSEHILGGGRFVVSVQLDLFYSIRLERIARV